jgi:hypothetical protein
MVGRRGHAELKSAEREVFKASRSKFSTHKNKLAAGLP